MPASILEQKINNGLHISSEDDIPHEFLQEIIARGPQEEAYPTTLYAGKFGEPISDISLIQKELSNGNLLYYMHQTPVGNDDLDSIFKKGLETVDPDYGVGSSVKHNIHNTATFYGVGDGGTINYVEDMLINHNHKNSDKAVIIALPQEFCLRMATSYGCDEHEAFYVKSDSPDDYQGLRIRPEFIKGYYDIRKKVFIPNTCFYENLSPAEQERLFVTVRRQYFKLCANVLPSDPSNYYKEFSESVTHKVPLSDDELKLASFEWYRVQYWRLQEWKNANNKVESPDGYYDDFDQGGYGQLI